MGDQPQLRVPQVRVLQLLAQIGLYGGLTRSAISKRLGTSTTFVGKTIGYSDPEKRAAFKLTKDGVAAGTPLLEMGYVVDRRVEIEGSVEDVVCITPLGYEAYSSLPQEQKRLPPPVDGWAKKKGRIETKETDNVHESDCGEERVSDSDSASEADQECEWQDLGSGNESWQPADGSEG